MMYADVAPLAERGLQGRENVLEAIANIQRIPGGKANLRRLSRYVNTGHKEVAGFLEPLEVAGYITIQHYPGGRIKRCDLTEFGWATVGNKPLEIPDLSHPRQETTREGA